MNKQSDRYRILVDVACQDPRGLSGIKDLAMAKSVVEDIAPKQKVRWLLVRIHFSRYPSELIAFLIDVYGNTHQDLEPVIEAFTKIPIDIFEQSDRDLIADAYWSSVVRERIVRGDFRRAYDEIRRAFKGFRPLPFTIEELLDVPYRDSRDMGASIDCIAMLVDELFTAMLAKDLVAPINVNELVHVHIDGQWSSPSGIAFVVATHGYHDGLGFFSVHNRREGETTRFGRQVLKIVESLNKKRKETRKRRVVRKMNA